MVFLVRSVCEREGVALVFFAADGGLSFVSLDQDPLSRRRYCSLGAHEADDVAEVLRLG
jgi:hypothetical protein